MHEDREFSSGDISEQFSARMIAPWNKGLGAMQRAMTVDEVVGLQWNLLREDLSLPTAVLYEEKLAHNLTWMQRFVDSYGVAIAPHGKTTMAPQLFARQLQAGAWGITLATVQQTRVAYEHGVRRVLMANQLVGRQNMEIVSELLRDTGFELYCLVDSVQLVEQLGAFFQLCEQRLNILIELGVQGGRTGVRTQEELDRVMRAIQNQRKALCLCGVELYEGVLQDETSIRTLLQWALEISSYVVKSGSLGRKPMILTGAGSAWYDVVAEVFSKADFGYPVEIVLRPGCYLTHDVGYREAQKQVENRNLIARGMQPSLVPALQLWAYVQSVPEREKAILTLGKRDAPFDAGLPTPSLHYRPGEPEPQPCPQTWELSRMMDQHAYMKIASGDDVRVGDMIGLDISHPCLTFDKWRYLPVLDSKFQVIDIIETFF